MFDFILKSFLIILKKLLSIILQFQTLLIEYKGNDVVFPDWNHQYHPKAWFVCQPRDEESATKLNNLLEFCHGSGGGDIFSKEKYKNAYLSEDCKWLQTHFKIMLELCDKITLHNIKIFEIEDDWLITRNFQFVSTSGTILRFKTRAKIEIIGPIEVSMKNIHIEPERHLNAYITVDNNAKLTLIKCSLYRGHYENLHVVALPKSRVHFINTVFFMTSHTAFLGEPFIKSKEKCDLEFIKCTFTNKKECPVWDWISFAFKGKILIKDCTFKENSLSKQSFIRFIFKGCDNVEMSDSKFNRPVCFTCIKGSKININNCHFKICLHGYQHLSNFCTLETLADVAINNCHFSFFTNKHTKLESLLNCQGCSKLLLYNSYFEAKGNELCHRPFQNMLLVQGYSSCLIDECIFKNHSRGYTSNENMSTILIRFNPMLIIKNSTFEKDISSNIKHIICQKCRCICDNNNFDEKNIWDDDDICFSN